MRLTTVNSSVMNASCLAGISVSGFQFVVNEDGFRANAAVSNGVVLRIYYDSVYGTCEDLGISQRNTDRWKIRPFGRKRCPPSSGPRRETVSLLRVQCDGPGIHSLLSYVEKT